MKALVKTLWLRRLCYGRAMPMLRRLPILPFEKRSIVLGLLERDFPWRDSKS